MFGYIGIDNKSLTKEEVRRYRASYCGLCRVIGGLYGAVGRAGLTYDMTFVSLLLTSLYDLEEKAGRQYCLRRPLRSHLYRFSAATEYAADMNIILAYYQALDDYIDDHNSLAGKKSKLLKEFLPEITRRHPRQCGVIKNSLEQLAAVEQSGELNPDIPTNCFGQVLGEVLVWREDEYADTLRSMGAALGRFVYLLDASNDLKADLRKQLYNPLAAQMDTDFLPVLTMFMGDCVSEFEKLPLKRDLHILQNILYSGVWMKYKAKEKVTK